MSRALASRLPLALLACAGCGLAGPHHVLDARGPQAARIGTLLVVTAAVATVVYVVVLVAWALAVRRGRARVARGDAPDERPDAERQALRRVGLAAGVSALLLLGYVGASAATGRAIATMDGAGASNAAARPGERPLVIAVRARQWWWEFEYQDPDPSRRLTAANELHLPVGRPVQFVGTAMDVIHSLWIPTLHGKQDLIPGYRQTTWLRADSAGEWVGECAEFCGHQHAKMRFTVTAESPDRFARWYESQLAPAVEPTDSLVARGRDLFVAGSCALCHAIDGTPARSRVGPPLTHLAARPTIAAGTLANTRENLRRWIRDPQAIKPGVRMPPNPLPAADMDALLAYLGTLR